VERLSRSPTADEGLGLTLEAFLRGQEFGGGRLGWLRPRICHSHQSIKFGSLRRCLMCPQCGEVGYGIRVGLVSGIVIRPINSSLAPRPGRNDVAHDIRDIIIALSEREQENFNHALFALAFFSRRQDRELLGAISRGLQSHISSAEKLIWAGCAGVR
jgi:hypothetical protein